MIDALIRDRDRYREQAESRVRALRDRGDRLKKMRCDRDRWRARHNDLTRKHVDLTCRHEALQSAAKVDAMTINKLKVLLQTFEQREST